MTSLPELLTQIDSAWYAVMGLLAALLWFAALLRVVREMRRASPIRPEQAFCGLPKGPPGSSPLARQLERSRHPQGGVTPHRTA